MLEARRQEWTGRNRQGHRSNEAVEEFRPGLAGDHLSVLGTEKQTQILAPTVDDAADVARGVVVALLLVGNCGDLGSCGDCGTQLERAAAILEVDAWRLGDRADIDMMESAADLVQQAGRQQLG